MTPFVRISDHVAFSPEKMQKRPLFASPNFFCDVYCLEPGQEQSPHAHADRDKVYLVLEGVADVRIGDETRTLRAGEAAHAGSGIAHGIVNPGPERAAVLVFMAPNP